MLNKSVSYKSLLRIVAGILILYGLYLVVCALTSQIVVTGDVQYSGPALFWDPGLIVTYIFYGGFFPTNSILPLPPQFPPFLSAVFLPGPFFALGLGILCLGFTFMRVRVMYWCVQSALWLISLSLWMPVTILLSHGSVDVPGSFIPLLVTTLALSFALLVAYKPVTHLLRKLFGLVGTPSHAHP